jgi:hypothetical protein
MIVLHIFDVQISSIHEQFNRRSLNRIKKNTSLSKQNKEAKHSLQKDLRIVNLEDINRFQLRRELERFSINS